MNKIFIGLSVALAGLLHVHLVDQAYNTGYEDAEMRLGATAEQCFSWWFGPNKKQFQHEIKQFCDKADK